MENSPHDARLAGQGTDLDHVADGEAANLAQSIAKLSATWSVADRSQALYSKLGAAIQVSPAPDKREHTLAAPTFLLGAQRSAALGFLALGRLHYQEADMLTRRGLELTAFTWMTWQDIELLRVWAHAVDGPPAFAIYRRAFKASAVDHALREVDPSLPTQYDELSRATHPTIHSLAASWESTQTEIRINFVDLKAGSIAPLAARVLMAARTHCTCVAGLSRRLLSGPAWRDARNSWRQHYQPVAQLLAQEIQRWREPYKRYQREFHERAKSSRPRA